jgi:hypothetical protein
VQRHEHTPHTRPFHPINEGGPYDSARNRMLALDYATQLAEMKAVAGQPDYALAQKLVPRERIYEHSLKLEDAS